MHQIHATQKTEQHRENEQTCPHVVSPSCRLLAGDGEGAEGHTLGAEATDVENSRLSARLFVRDALLSRRKSETKKHTGTNMNGEKNPTQKLNEYDILQ